MKTYSIYKQVTFYGFLLILTGGCGPKATSDETRWWPFTTQHSPPPSSSTPISASK